MAIAKAREVRIVGNTHACSKCGGRWPDVHFAIQRHRNKPDGGPWHACTQCQPWTALWAEQWGMSEADKKAAAKKRRRDRKLGVL